MFVGDTVTAKQPKVNLGRYFGGVREPGRTAAKKLAVEYGHEPA